MKVFWLPWLGVDRPGNLDHLAGIYGWAGSFLMYWSAGMLLPEICPKFHTAFSFIHSRFPCLPK